MASVIILVSIYNLYCSKKLSKFDLEMVRTYGGLSLGAQTIGDLVFVVVLCTGGFFDTMGIFQELWIFITLANYSRIIYLYITEEVVKYNPIYLFSFLILDISFVIAGGFFTGG